MAQKHHLDQLPSIEELLEGSGWETRLENARMQRQEALRRRADTKRKAQAPGDSPADPQKLRTDNVLRLTVPAARQCEPAAVAVPAQGPPVNAEVDDPSESAKPRGLRMVRVAATCVLVGGGFAGGFAAEMWRDAGTPVFASSPVVARSAVALEPPLPAERLEQVPRPDNALQFGSGIARGELALERELVTVIEEETQPPLADAPSAEPAGVVVAATEDLPGEIDVVPVRGLVHLAGGGSGSAPDALRSVGFELLVSPLPSLAVEGAEVRYFHAADREDAEAAARAVDAALWDYSSFRPSPSAGTIEIVLSDSDG